jgi:tetratricopeptide (TPR) repeat protein
VNLKWDFMAKKNLKAHALIERGVNAHKAGQFDTAEIFYKRALKSDKNNADLLHLLGLISHQTGRHKYAAQLIKRALLIKPDEPNYSINLAIILNTLSLWLEAEKVCLATIEIVPKNAEVYNNLGRALAAQNKFINAEAAYAKSIECAPGNVSAQSNLGNLYMMQGRHKLAENAFLKAIKTDETFLLAYSNLATTYLTMGSLDRAEEICRAALLKDPTFVPASHSLGVVLTRMKKFKAAEKVFKRVMELSPRHTQSVINLASLYSVQGKFGLAKALFKEVLQLEPKNSDAYLNLGVCCSELGQLDDALDYIKTALKYDPDNIEAYYVLSTSRKIKLDAGAIKRLQMMLASEIGTTADQRIKIHFALAMQLELLGDLGGSFGYYESGNQGRSQLFKNSGLNFDYNQHYQKLQSYESTFTKKFFEKWKKFEDGMPSAMPAPIFIIGMPRSGTTLIEQIIGKHPSVVVGGELSIIGGFIDVFMKKNGGLNRFPSSSEELDFDQIKQWSKVFSGRLQQIGDGARYVIDKTPFNYNHLWLIQLMFPAAKIIHCVRDTRDVGLSCFQQNFIEEYPWSCGLTQIGHYINAYGNLMDFWHKTLQLSIIDVIYEDVVFAVEDNSRAILEFLELEWYHGILDFHIPDSKIKTASKWQAREPVYKQSVGRWKKYEKQLIPLFNALKRF